MAPRPQGKQVIHSKFVLCNKRNYNATVQRLKTGLVVYRIEEEGKEKIRPSPMLYFKAIKLIVWLATQTGYRPRHVDFQNLFSKGIVHRPAYVEMPKYVFSGENVH